MTKRIAKTLIIGVLIVMGLGLFVGCGGGYEYKEGDLNLTIEVDKTEVQIGDTITVTARLENLSGENIRIQMRHTDWNQLQDMVLIGLFQDDNHDFILNSKGGPRKKFTIKKAEVISKTVQFEVTVNTDSEALSSVTFYAGKGFNNLTTIKSNIQKITIKTEN